jgi:ribosome biogenesis GTPase
VKDKGCAVREAAEQGSISMARYQRFLKLREKMPTANVGSL